MAKFLFNVCLRSEFSPIELEGEGIDEEAPNRMVENEPCGTAEMNATEKVQKVYKIYRTRCRLADSVVVAEEFWYVILFIYSATFAFDLLFYLYFL